MDAGIATLIGQAVGDETETVGTATPYGRQIYLFLRSRHLLCNRAVAILLDYEMFCPKHFCPPLARTVRRTTYKI